MNRNLDAQEKSLSEGNRSHQTSKRGYLISIGLLLGLVLSFPAISSFFRSDYGRGYDLGRQASLQATVEMGMPLDTSDIESWIAKIPSLERDSERERGIRDGMKKTVQDYHKGRSPVFGRIQLIYYKFLSLYD